MSDKRHVLFILEYYYPHLGGVETLFRSLAESLIDQGYKVTVLTNRYDHKLPAREIVNGVTIRRYRFYNRYLFTFLAWIPAWKYAKQAEIIHTTSYNAAMPARLVAKMTGTTSVITFHEYWGALWDRLPWISPFMAKLYAAFERMISGFRFDRLVAVSNYTREALVSAGVDKNRAITIYNGIDYTQFERRELRKAHQPFQFLFFGRVSFSKGIDILIPAIDKAIETGLACRFSLVIPSEETPIFKEVMAELHDSKYKDFVDIYHDLSFELLKQKIATADAVVIPSYSEGFCYAAVETMAIGTPIISSGRGALAEVISGKYITMRTHDSDGLFAVFQEAIDGNWNDSKIIEFKLEDTVKAYLKMYKELE